MCVLAGRRHDRSAVYCRVNTPWSSGIVWFIFLQLFSFNIHYLMYIPISRLRSWIERGVRVVDGMVLDSRFDRVLCWRSWREGDGM